MSGPSPRNINTLPAATDPISLFDLLILRQFDIDNVWRDKKVTLETVQTLFGGGGGGGVTSVSGTLNRISSTGGTTPAIDIDPAYIGQTSITDLGTITTGVWNGSKLEFDFGGTGLTSYAAGDLLYASALNTLAKLPVASNGDVLTLAAGLPAWAPAPSGSVVSVSGTVNRVTSTGGTTPAIDISASYVGQTSLTTLGTVTTGVWNGTTIDYAHGGTGQTAYAKGDLIYASAINTLSKLNVAADGTVLTLSAGVPVWSVPAAGTVTNVTGTANRVTSTGGATPAIDISASYVGQSSITTLGTITTGVWNGSTIDYAHGGTGQTSYAAGDLIYASAINTLAKLPVAADGRVLTLSSGLPVWSVPAAGTVTSVSGTTNRITSTGGATPAIDISASYVGQASITTLGTITAGVWNGTAIAATSGGTGQTGYAVGDLLYASSTTALTKLAVGSNTNVLTLAAGVPTWAAPASTGVTSVAGTSNRITSTGGATPAIDISASYVGQTSLTTLGTITTGVWNGTAIDYARGGTGQTSYAAGDLIYASAINTLAKLPVAADGRVLTLSGGLPVWSVPAAGTVTGVTGTTNRITSSGGATPAIDISASYVGQASITTLGTITTGVWTGTNIALANGGTNASLTASNGGILYSTATAAAILSGTATANQMLQSGASGAPAWSTATYPATTTINQLLYSSAANTISGLATGNGGVLTTSASGVPSIDTTNFNVLTTGVQVKGNGTNTAPPAGFIGQQITANASGSALTTNVTKNITSISLTAGIWDVSGFGYIVGTGNMNTQSLGISTTSATLGAAAGINFNQFVNSPVGPVGSALTAPMVRATLSATTTYYLVAQSVFSTGTVACNGLITATRVG